MGTRQVTLPSPLAHQRDILLDGHRFKVADCGRRFGKTLFGLIAILDGHGPWDLTHNRPKFFGALHGATIWWVAPIDKILKKIWRDLKRAMRKWGCEYEKDETEKRIDFPGGGSITVKSGFDPDSLRGDGIHGVVLDEAAYLSEAAWNLALRPTLADFEGWAILISSPKGKNWFYQEWRLGAEGLDPDYAAWKRPTSDNPTIAPAELEKMRRKMGVYAFRRECEAEFEVTEGVAFFARDWFKFYSETETHLVPDAGKPVARTELTVFMTADLALSLKTYSDFTVVIVWGRAPDGRLFVLDLHRGKHEPSAIAGVVKRIFDSWRARVIWLEASGPLVRLNEEIRSSGMPVREYKIHADKGRNDKATRASPCATAVQEGRVLFLKGALWVSELVSECCAFPDPAVHDDQVDALALGVLVAPPVQDVPKDLPGQGYERRDRGEEGSRWRIGR